MGVQSQTVANVTIAMTAKVRRKRTTKAMLYTEKMQDD